MKILLFILWLISLLIWIIYAIKTIIELIKNEDYMEYCLKMNIAVLFVLLFCILINIFK